MDRPQRPILARQMVQDRAHLLLCLLVDFKVTPSLKTVSFCLSVFTDHDNGSRVGRLERKNEIEIP